MKMYSCAVYGTDVTFQQRMSLSYVLRVFFMWYDRYSTCGEVIQRTNCIIYPFSLYLFKKNNPKLLSMLLPRAEHELHWNLVSIFFHFQDAAVSSSSPPEKGKDEKSKPDEKPAENKKWAIPVDITSPCDDFYKRIPNPAFKVTHFFFSFCAAVPFYPNFFKPSPLLCVCMSVLTNSRCSSVSLFPLLGSSGHSSWTSSRNRLCWGWRLMTPCL